MSTMQVGLVGRKVGMTQIFQESGHAVSVTVIEVMPNYVTQVKSQDTDGYTAIQVTTGSKKSSRLNQPLKGHYKKANIEAGRGLWEFRLKDADKDSYNVGDAIDVSIFEKGQKIDVRSKSKGKGFAGVVKRWNFRTQDMTHGNSLSHRAPGSIGQCQTPGRVFKGKKMSGQLGNTFCTVQNLEVVDINKDKNYLLIKGGVPGAPGCDVIIRPAVKACDVQVTA